jgi:hypothetical protein
MPNQNKQSPVFLPKNTSFFVSLVGGTHPPRSSTNSGGGGGPPLVSALAGSIHQVPEGGRASTIPYRCSGQWLFFALTVAIRGTALLGAVGIRWQGLGGSGKAFRLALCHVERSAAESRPLAANRACRSLAARFLRAAFGLGRNDRGRERIRTRHRIPAAPPKRRRRFSALISMAFSGTIIRPKAAALWRGISRAAVIGTPRELGRSNRGTDL